MSLCARALPKWHHELFRALIIIRGLMLRVFPEKLDHIFIKKEKNENYHTWEGSRFSEKNREMKKRYKNGGRRTQMRWLYQTWAHAYAQRTRRQTLLLLSETFSADVVLVYNTFMLLPFALFRSHRGTKRVRESKWRGKKRFQFFSRFYKHTM